MVGARRPAWVILGHGRVAGKRLCRARAVRVFRVDVSPAANKCDLVAFRGESCLPKYVAGDAHRGRRRVGVHDIEVRKGLRGPGEHYLAVSPPALRYAPSASPCRCRCCFRCRFNSGPGCIASLGGLLPPRGQRLCPLPTARSPADTFPSRAMSQGWRRRRGNPSCTANHPRGRRFGRLGIRRRYSRPRTQRSRRLRRRSSGRLQPFRLPRCSWRARGASSG